MEWGSAACNPSVGRKYSRILHSFQCKQASILPPSRSHLSPAHPIPSLRKQTPDSDSPSSSPLSYPSQIRPNHSPADTVAARLSPIYSTGSKPVGRVSSREQWQSEEHHRHKHRAMRLRRLGTRSCASGMGCGESQQRAQAQGQQHKRFPDRSGYRLQLGRYRNPRYA